MKSEDLLEAMSGIREDYILEAEPETAAGTEISSDAPEESDALSHGTRYTAAMIRFRRYSRSFGLAAAALLCILGIQIYRRLETNRVSEQSMRAEVKTEGKKEEKTTEITDDSALPDTSEKDMFFIDQAGKNADSSVDSYLDAGKEPFTERRDDTEGALFAEAEENASIASEENASIGSEENVSMSSEENASITLEENASIAFEEDASMDAMENTWTSCESLAEAEEIAGFSLKLPKEFSDPVYSEPMFFAIKASSLKVQFLDINGIEGGCIKKTVGTVSVEDNNETYSTEETVKVDDRDVTLKGNNGTIQAACWSENEFSYELLTKEEGFERESLFSMIQEIR